MAGEWWEKEPLRFACQSGCVKCCLTPGVIFFDAEDIEKASAYLRMSPDQFKAECLVRENGEWMIDVSEVKRCPFLAAYGCKIHDAKPKQCQTYPFWRENLESKRHWKAVGLFCPGVNVGPEVPAGTVRENLEKDRKAPDIFSF